MARSAAAHSAPRSGAARPPARSWSDVGTALRLANDHAAAREHERALAADPQRAQREHEAALRQQQYARTLDLHKGLVAVTQTPGLHQALMRSPTHTVALAVNEKENMQLLVRFDGRGPLHMTLGPASGDLVQWRARQAALSPLFAFTPAAGMGHTSAVEKLFPGTTDESMRSTLHDWATSQHAGAR